MKKEVEKRLREKLVSTKRINLNERELLQELWKARIARYKYVCVCLGTSIPTVSEIEKWLCTGPPAWIQDPPWDQTYQLTGRDPRFR